jgi:type IV pilus assembly protein PilP
VDEDGGPGCHGQDPALPVVEPYEPVPYDAGNILDPFKAAKMGPQEKKGGGGFRPDLDRPKEPLELHPLETLKYVGVMTRKKVSYAIIQVDGTLYQVKIGNYMGQNFGVVVDVSESESDFARAHSGFRRVTGWRGRAPCCCRKREQSK